MSSGQQSDRWAGQSIPGSKRHFPMIEFFNDEPIADKESDEVRQKVHLEEFDEIEEVTHRPDMENRVVDVVRPLRDTCNMFFSCLSKEIFGTEDHYNFIREHICEELLGFPKKYKSLMLDVFNDEQEFVEIHTEGLKKNFPVQVLDIIAVATFFQTPLYVLIIDTDGSSRWKVYTQI